MYFEFVQDVTVPGIKGKSFGGATELYKYCHEAERNSRIDPDKTMIAIRQALEVLTSALLLEKGTSLTETRIGKDGKERKVAKTLNDMIEECRLLYGNSISGEQFKEIDGLRQDSNRYVHVDKQSKNKTEYTIKGKHASVKTSSNATISLYHVLAKIFGAEDLDVSKYDLPIGDYEIVEKIKTEPYEPIEDKYKYLAKKEGSIVSTYAYIRPLVNKRNNADAVYNERDIAIQDVLKNIRSSEYIVNGEEIPVATHTDVRYLKYNVRKDTKTLNVIVKTLQPLEVLQIISDVSKGLLEIMSGNVNIHHRSIKPTCIFVQEEDGKKRGKIGCFETAKIEIESQAIETVHVNLLKKNVGSIYIHPMLLETREVSGIEWEKGDVYSLSVIILYCLDSDGISAGALDYSLLLESFSEEFSTSIISILSSGAIDIVPRMKEFYQIIRKEMEYANV